MPQPSKPLVIINRTTSFRLTFKLLDFVHQVLAHLKIRTGSYEFTFVDAQTILHINRTYLQHDYVTDIITFALSEAPEPLSGDIYICVPQAKENAKAEGQSFADEIRLLIVHGILHVNGYTDEKPKEKSKMDQEQQRILKALAL